MKTSYRVATSSILGFAATGLCLFGPAGTLDYWQGWLLLAVITIGTAAFTIYLAITSPAALQRRMHGGPTAETRPIQKLAVSALLISILSLALVSAFDYRFGWSTVPTWLVLCGDAGVVLGLSVAMLVVVQNSYAAASITVEAGQTVTSTGLYGAVRHPMYSGSLLMMAGIPLALGSYWGLLGLPIGVAAIVVRILDEEKMLRHDLPGYNEYAAKVHSRLIPHVW